MCSVRQYAVNIKPCSPLILPKRQAAADDFQADSVFFQVDAAEVRIGQADIAAEFVVGFLAASDRGLLFGDGDGIPFFQIVQVFLQQDIAAARIGFSLRG